MFCNCNQKHGTLAIILKVLGHIVAIIGLWQHSWPMIVLAAILLVLSFMDWTTKAKEEVKDGETVAPEEKKEEVMEKPEEVKWEAPTEPVEAEPVETEPEVEMPEEKMPEMPEMPEEKAPETM